MILIEASVEDAINYSNNSKDYSLSNYNNRVSALADPQFAIKYINYLIKKNIQIPIEFELSLFKNRSMDYAKKYIDMIKSANIRPSDAFIKRISKTSLKNYLPDIKENNVDSNNEISSFNITFSPKNGSDIHTLVSEAIAISKRLEMDISFTFHGIEVPISTSSKYEEVVNRILSKLYNK